MRGREPPNVEASYTGAQVSGEWRVASGEWRVASGEWRVASGNRTPYPRPSPLTTHHSPLTTHHSPLALRGAIPAQLPAMADKNADLHGNVPDKAEAALLLIDVLNDLE